MKRNAAALMNVTFLVGLAAAGRAQNCGYPWDVMATAVDSQTVAVHLCGRWAGCPPHDPQFRVVGDQIQVSMTAGDPDGCQCIQVQGTTDQTILVTPLAAGTYGVTAVLNYCGQPILLGTTTVVVESCTADARTLCLNQGRFAVTASFTSVPRGLPVQATAVPLTVDTGYFWFFDPANVELVVKVLDGCVLNGGYWVFAGGLTNLGVALEVTDTRSGATRPYTNALGSPFQPIQDSSAFACP